MSRVFICVMVWFVLCVVMGMVCCVVRDCFGGCC